jgi:hypothetical protein
VVNRSAVLVRPRQPYLDWAKAQGDGDSYPTCGERNVYLLPPFETEDDADDIIRHFYDIIFEAELADWITDPSTWPEDRSYDTFLAWFEVEHNSLVEDLVDDDPLIDDEL